MSTYGEQHASDVAREAAARTAARNVTGLNRLAPFLAPYRGMIAIAALALLAAAGATLAVPIAVAQMIDHGFSAENAGAIRWYFLFLMGVAAGLAVATAVRFWVVTWIGERVVADLRRAVHDHILSLSPVFFERTRTGEVLSRLTTDTTVIQSVVGSSVSIALRNMVTLIGGAILLVITSWQLSGLVLLALPIIILPLIVFGRFVRRLSRASQDRVADTSARAGETFNAIQTVQAFTREGAEQARFAGAVEAAFDVAIRRTTARAWLTFMVIVLVFGCVASVLYVGAQAVLAGTMSAGELSQFILYAVLVAGAIGALSEIWGELLRAAGAAERLAELLAEPAEIAAPAAPAAMPEPGAGRIEFEDVVFAYPARPEVNALDGVSLTIAPGETVALVGPSGAGKSTVFQLLLRFFDPQDGAIRIDGVELREADPRAVRARTAFVPQDVVVFSGTIAENIAFGRPDADRAAIEAAAAAANAAGFIADLPDGYETVLGERGVTLSGGQRQRLALARAILRDAPILLLDEATSALDAESERLVQDALGRVMKGRTTLVIAHRLATVRAADRIVVFDQGRIVAEGRHDALIAGGGLYARLAQLQFGRVAGAAD